MNSFQDKYHVPTSYMIAMEVFYDWGSNIDQNMTFNDVGGNIEHRNYDPNWLFWEQDNTNLYYFS